LEAPERAASFFAPVPIPIEVIVHAFSMTASTLASWFHTLGPQVTAVHVQCRDEAGHGSGIARHREPTDAALHHLHELGFRGVFVLEFTVSTCAPDKSPETLWQAALTYAALRRRSGLL